MGALAHGTRTGRIRKGGATDLRRTAFFSHISDERRLDVVEKLIPLADKAGLPLTHPAMAFVIAHPGVTSALLGARTVPRRNDLADQHHLARVDQHALVVGVGHHDIREVTMLPAPSRTLTASKTHRPAVEAGASSAPANRREMCW